jgi:hypothetical protein
MRDLSIRILRHVARGMVFLYGERTRVAGNDDGRSCRIKQQTSIVSGCFGSSGAAKFTLELRGISLEWMRLLILELSLAGR